MQYRIPILLRIVAIEISRRSLVLDIMIKTMMVNKISTQVTEACSRMNEKSGD